MRPAVISSLFLVCLLGCTQKPKLFLTSFFHPEQAIAPPAELNENPLRGDIAPVHDPTLIQQGPTYYSITGDVPFLPPGNYLPISCSDDRISWKPCGHIFDTIPGWVRTSIPEAKGLWAPDISYFDGFYHVYYAASSLGSQHSSIGLATNTTLNPNDPMYRWLDRGLVFSSNAGDTFNAIDPNILLDRDGKVWLTYGSYWSGIKQREINPATGMLSRSSITVYSLAARLRTPDHSLEGASLVQHGDYYYLFASIGLCCEIPIERDTYRQIVGRSRSLHGPFIDQAGVSMRRGGGNILLQTTAEWLAPGGGSVSIDSKTGETLIAFHALKKSENGTLYLWIRTIDWVNDWPVVR